ncbi:MAG: hypothetical protein ABI239_07120 [Aquihabitans sp.]
MGRLDRRWLRRILAVGLVATLPVVASSAPVAAAGNGCPDGGSWDIRWTGAAGDEAWTNPGNWEPNFGGSARTPTTTDKVCIDTSVGGGVISEGLEVETIELAGGPTDPAVRLSGTISVQLMVGNGPVQFIDDAEVTGLAFQLVNLTVDPDASVDLTGALRTDGLLDVGGQLTQFGSSLFDAVTVRPGGDLQVEMTGAGECVNAEPCATFTGPLDVQSGASASVTGDGIAIFHPTATLVAGTVDLRDVSVHHEGPFPLSLTMMAAAPVVIEEVGAGASLTVQRVSGSAVPFDITLAPGTVFGTLQVTGRPGPAGPVDRVEGAMVVAPGGSVALNGIDASFGLLANEGTLRLDRTVVRAEGTAPFVLVNVGRLEIGARQGTGSDPLRASAVFTENAELLNLGEVVAVDPSAELVLGGYASHVREDGTPLRGTLSVPVSAVVPVAHMPLFSDTGAPLMVPWLAWGAGGVGVVVDGVTEGASGRVEVEGLLRDVGNRRLVVLPGEGYSPCAGERWPVATFDRAALGYRRPTAGTSSVPGAQRSAITTSIFGGSSGWSVVASDRPGSVVATVTGTSSGGCSTPAGGRFVSALYVEGTGRVPTDAEYALRAGRSSTVADRMAQARVVLKGAEARGHLIDEQYRRILDRRVDSGAAAIWGPRLAGGWTPDQLRATLYGSTEFWNLNGRSLGSVTNAVYQRELGRSATAAERLTIVRKVNAGTTRAAAFTAVMRIPEVDITTGAAMVERWWAREPTLYEAFYVGALLYRGNAELMVAADLAAGLPLD